MRLCLARTALLTPLLGLGVALGSELDAKPGTPPVVKPAKSAPPEKTEGTCGSFGTSVEFEESPSAAAKKAKKEEKLVFVLHVSGNFEDPRFT